jgi:hypothetical protein
MPDYGAQFEIDYMPAFGGGVLNGPGRWFEAESGFIWTNDAGNLNILDFDDTQAVTNFITVKELMRDRGLSASQAFDLLYEEQTEEYPGTQLVTGDLDELDRIFSDIYIVDVPVVAAAPVAGQVVTGVEYGITVDDDGNVLELVQVSPDGVFVRTNNTWVAIDTDSESDDDTVFGREWFDVTEDAVELYDTLETEDSMQKVEFDSVIVN